MLDTGDGGGGTPWESMTLDLMQRLIQNPDIEAHWQLVEAWNKSAQLLGDHLWQMQEYRSNLAAVWPPQKSPAAAAYLDRLDELISNVNETYEASIANHRAFSVVTGSIGQAQAKMQMIYQEYQTNKAALPLQGGTPSVALQRQEELRLQAVKLLSSVSTDLAEAQSQIVKPAQYKTITERGDAATPVTGDHHVAPPIPPIVPRPAAHRTPSTSARSTTILPTPGVDGSQPGLILGGVAQPTVLSPSVIRSNPIDPAFPGGTSGPLSIPVLPPPSAGIFPAIGSPIPPSRPGTRPDGGMPREGTTRPGASIPEGTTRATTPSGFFGGVPAAGSAQSRSRRTTARRINPVGGVIGEGGRALGSRRGVGISGSEAGEHPTGLYGSGAGRRPGPRHDDDRPRWDPENPWEIAEGVDPIVLPPRERPIDPGPVIGLG